MRKSERLYNEALKSYNRTAAQLKRYYDVKPSEYLEGVHTAKGVERALDQLRREAERQQIEKRVERYEKEIAPTRAFETQRKKIERQQAPKFYMNEEKQKAYEEAVQQYQTAAETFNKNWGIPTAQYDQFVQFIGSLDDAMIENFGSENLVEMFRTGTSRNLSPSQIFQKVNAAYNMGGDQESVINNFYESVR